MIGITLAILTQVGWLLSISLCTWDLEVRNSRLNKRIEELEGKE
jgi:hypothetical protein